MTTFKRVLSCLLVVAMLASMAVVVSAEEASSIFGDTVQHSITEEDRTGMGLAFLIKMNVAGAQVNARNEFVNTNATAIVDDEEYAVVKMGAVMANRAAAIANIDNVTLDDVDRNYILDVPAKYLYDVPTADSCCFAVRIINLPATVLGRAIACRPYIVLKDAEGNERTIYGSGNIATYNQVLYQNEPEKTPVLNVAVPELDDRLEAAATAVKYAAYDPATYVEAFQVTLTLSNVSANAKTSEGDTILCTFKDAEGNVLGNGTVAVGVIKAGESKEDVEIYVPVGTAIIEATQLNLNYVPDIIMPAIGSDIDVTKKKNRIRVSATEASFNEDGTIHVKWTFKNYTSNWITEETDCIKYGYYKDGTRKGLATLYIGVIDTKKNPVKTFEFDVPAYTTEVRITSSKIVYWTEWA